MTTAAELDAQGKCDDLRRRVAAQQQTISTLTSSLVRLNNLNATLTQENARLQAELDEASAGIIDASTLGY